MLLKLEYSNRVEKSGSNCYSNGKCKRTGSIFGLCNHYDKMFSTTKKDSDISKINQSKTKGCKVNHVVSDVIKDSIKYSKKSKGAFDVTIGELSDMWNVTGDNPTVPDDKKLKKPLNM